MGRVIRAKITGTNGIDNQNETFLLSLLKGNISPLTSASNVDVLNTQKVRRRPGRIPKLSGVKNLGTDGEILLGTVGESLVSISTESFLSFSILKNSIGSGKMQYAKVRNFIIYTNNSTIGYVYKGAAYDIPPTDTEYKRPIPPGHMVMVYKNRVYIARHNLIYVSDPVAPFRYDIRTGLLQFDSRITMMLPLDAGVYISDQSHVEFLAGDSPGKFVAKKVAMSGAYEGSGAIAQRMIVNRIPQNSVAWWSSSEGVLMGLNDGTTKDALDGRFVPDQVTHGVSVVRHLGDIRQYIAILK